ncbi:ribonuclease H-like domain-containing protein [Tanacetum coccineum]
MYDEYKALIDNETWVLVPRSPNVNIVRSMWLYKHKYNADGSLSRYKARLVANGRSQQQGIDCDETFNPVVKTLTIRTVLTLAVSRQWPIHHLDMKNAFLHGHLTKTVYILIELILIMFAFCKSRFMALSRAPELGYSDFPAMLFESVSITTKPTRLFSSFTRGQTRLTYYYLGPLNYFLLRVLPLAYYCLRRNLLPRFLSGHRCLIVTLSGLQLTLRRSLDLKDHRSLILLYIAALPEHFSTSPLPDPICHMQFNSYVFTCMILDYLRGTTDLGLQLFRSTTSQLIAYSDTDWAGCPATRRSTSGYCVFLGDNLLTWSSKRQDTLSCSSTEAEYRGVANAIAGTSWIRNLLRELHTLLFTATFVYCNNVSTVYMSANPVQHQRTKHIEIDIHFVRDKLAAVHVRVLHVPSRF